MYERQLAKKLANQGLLKRKVPPPACSLLDIFQGEYKPFLETHNKQFPTAILFWTPWSVLCNASHRCPLKELKEIYMFFERGINV